MKKRPKHLACALTLMVGGLALSFAPEKFLFGSAPLRFFSPPALAQGEAYGFSPQTYRSGVVYGTGVYFAPYQFTLYSKPDAQSQPIGVFHWSHSNTNNQVEVTLPNGDRHSVYASRTFLSFYPGMDIAMMAVLGENGDGWAEVIYDQGDATRSDSGSDPKPSYKSGWVRLTSQEDPVRQTGNTATTATPAHFGVYQTWLEFMRLNAKADGAYWLSGVTPYHRSVRMADADDAKLVPVTIIRNMTVKHVRGDWLLVEVLDFERNRPLGWVRWRDDDGNLMMFPNLSGRRSPIVITAY